MLIIDGGGGRLLVEDPPRPNWKMTVRIGLSHPFSYRQQVFDRKRVALPPVPRFIRR